MAEVAAKPNLLIACGALAQEIVALQRLNHWGGRLEVTCLPAIWHNTPDKIPEGVRRKIKAGRKKYDRIFVAYGDCGTGGQLDRLLEEEKVERIPGPHCYSFFAGNDDFARRWDDDLTAFFLTDFLARQFEAFVIEPLGLNRHPELRDMYFGHYRKLVYLSQQEDEGLQEKARKAAERLGLEYEYRFTGYGDLTTSLLTA